MRERGRETRTGGTEGAEPVRRRESAGPGRRTPVHDPERAPADRARSLSGRSREYPGNRAVGRLVAGVAVAPTGAVRSASGREPPVCEVLRAAGRRLDPAVRSALGARLGVTTSFDDVRVHDDERAARAAAAVGAEAFTVGRDVVFGRGRFAPGSAAGRRLLAHELVHTLQQRDPPVADGPAIDLAPEDALEAEAARLSAAVADGRRTGGPATVGTAPVAIRRQVDEDRPSGSVGLHVGTYEDGRPFVEGLFLADESEAAWTRRMVGGYLAHFFPRWSPERRAAEVDRLSGLPTRWVGDGGRPRDGDALRRLVVLQRVHEDLSASYGAEFGLTEAERILEPDLQALEGISVPEGGQDAGAPDQRVEDREFLYRFERTAREVTQGLLTRAEALLLAEQRRYAEGGEEELEGLGRAAYRLTAEARYARENPYTPVPEGVAPSEREEREAVGEFPVLGGMSPLFRQGLAEPSTLTPPRRLIDRHVEDMRERIAEVRDDVSSGALNVWLYPRILDATMAEMGVEPRGRERYLVEDRRLHEIITDAAESTVLAVLSAVFSLLAAVSTGGVAVLFGTAALAAGGLDLAYEVSEYEEQEATSRIQFDRGQALSDVEPSAFWLGVSIVGFFVDAAGFLDATENISRVVSRTSRVSVTSGSEEAEVLADVATSARREWTRLSEEGSVVVPPNVTPRRAENEFVSRAVSGARRDLEGVPRPDDVAGSSGSASDVVPAAEFERRRLGRVAEGLDPDAARSLPSESRGLRAANDDAGPPPDAAAAGRPPRVAVEEEGITARAAGSEYDPDLDTDRPRAGGGGRRRGPHEFGPAPATRNPNRRGSPGNANDPGSYARDRGRRRSRSTDPSTRNAGFRRGPQHPSPDAVEIDMAHVMDRHHPSGRVAGNREAARQGAIQRGQGYETNDVWPAEFSAERIERIVRRAYRNADARVGHDARSGYTLLQGSANGFRVEFWIDFRTGNVRTAYPIGPG